MHRYPIEQQIIKYRETDSACQVATRFLDFIGAQPNCFERHLPIGHLTGSAWVVDNRGERVLLTHHRKLNRWLQLGGHADGETDLAAVAMREAAEESGLSALELVDTEIFDLDVHLIPGRPAEPAHYHFDVRYAIRATGDEAYVVSDESHDLAWVEIRDLANYSTELSMLRMRDKWLAR